MFQAWKSPPQATKSALSRLKGPVRDAGAGGGGGSGGNLPPQLGSCGGRPPKLWTVNVVHFYFCLFLHVNLGLSPKIVGQIRGVFIFGYGLPWTPGDVCPPPQLQSISAPLWPVWSLTRAPLGYFYNAPHWGGGGLFRAPPLISETTGPILKIQAAFESPGKTVEGKQILLTSGSRVTSQVRSKSKCSTFRAWWHRRAELRC